MTHGHDARLVLDWLLSRQRPLLLTHEHPDGDAFGSLLGLLAALHDLGRPAVAYLGAPLPRRYRNILAVPANLCVGGPVPSGEFDGTVCLDTTGPERLVLPPGWTPTALPTPVGVVDHHADNRRFGDVRWVAPEMAATAQMLARMLREGGIGLSPAVATWLLTGLLMDTGGLRYLHAGPAILHDAAYLLERGADGPHLMRELFLRDPYPRRRLEARVLDTARFACGGRLVCGVLEPATLQELGVEPEDTENLVDTLKTLEGVEIACLLQPEPGRMRFSFRSQSPRYPVNELARVLGGGGHVMAAGAKVPGMTVADAEVKVVELAQRMLPHD